ncbi:MAG: polysaccharide pyruvyl transferase family protein [Clostridium sp.]
MKILITGYYGAGNFGDDIMLEAFCKNIKEKNKNIKISILKMYDKKLNINLDKDVKVINFYKIPKLKAKIFKYLVKKYDMFLWVGGTCFTDEDGNGFYNYMNLAKESGTKFGYVGVGIGKLTIKDRIEKTKYLLENCDFISFRDKRSYEYAKSIVSKKKNMYLTEDLAYLFINSVMNKKVVKENKKRKVIVSWRNLLNYKTIEEEKKMIDILINFLKEIMNEKIETDILILPLDDIKDYKKNKEIYNELKKFENEKVKVLYKENLTPKEKVTEILKGNINISSRLHGIFVSEIANIKTIGISYSIKIDEFLESIGKNCDLISIDDLEEGKLYSIYKAENKNVTDELVKEKVYKSKKNIEYLIEFLEKR